MKSSLMLLCLAPFFLHFNAQAIASLEAPLTQGEIAGVIKALNEGEIAVSLLAVSHANAAVVIIYSQKMIQEHQDSTGNLEAVMMKKGEVFLESALSKSIAQTASKTVKLLDLLQGQAFEIAFMDSEIQMHDDTLKAIDALLTMADADLTAFLNSMKIAVQNHLNEATVIRDGL